MLSLPLALLSLLPLINAQTTVSLFMPEADSQSLVASVISVDATATTYFVECGSAGSTSSTLPSTASSSGQDEDSSECGFPSGITHTQGPSTAAFTLAYEGITMAMSCQLSGTIGAVCTESQNNRPQIQSDYSSYATGADYSSASAAAKDSGPAESTLSDGAVVATLSGHDIQYLPVVVTAGADKLRKQKPLGTATSMSSKTSSAGSKATSTSTKAAGSAVAKATGAAGRVNVVGVMGGMGALAIGVAAVAL